MQKQQFVTQIDTCMQSLFTNLWLHFTYAGKKKDLSAINNMNIEPPSVQIKNDLTWSFCAYSRK